MPSKKKIREDIILTEHRVNNTAETDFPDTYGEDDDVWSHQKFKSNFRVAIVKMDKMEMEFDLIGVSCSIANAIRRILLSEVPSMAIEKVFVSNNTTVIKDEVLSHRLGLVPLRADPRLFDFPTEGLEDANEQNTLVFELKIKCTTKSDCDKNSSKLEDKYKNHSVFSKHINWVPQGSQASVYKEKNVGPVYPDILLNKLRPGQELDLKMHAVKGLGKDHAKFSPVATAFYRMLPKIELLREVKGEAALRLKKCFSPGVIGLEGDEKKAVVIDARYDSCSRNVFRHEDLKDAVAMSRVRNHFIFSIESVGALQPSELFIEAVEVLRKKCNTYLQELSDST